MRLLDRLFSRTKSQEDMATELIAYFLETCEPFLEKFLRAVEVPIGAGNWQVETQFVLSTTNSPAPRWKGKRIDLVLRCNNPPTVVAIEAKIDAGVTYHIEDDGTSIPQTQLYAEWIKEEAENIGGRGQLVTLTRWKPNSDLIGDIECKSLRYYDVTEWLNKAAREVNLSTPVVADLAYQFVRFLRRKRWALPEISKEEHLTALAESNLESLAVGEVVEQLWDVVTAAAHDAVEGSGRKNGKRTWQWVKGTRSSTGSYCQEHSIGKAIWHAPIMPVSATDTERISLGMSCGYENSQPVICPLLQIPLNKAPQLDEQQWRFVESSNLWVGENLVPKFDEMRSTGKVWDYALKQFQIALESLVKLRQSPPLGE